MCAAKVHIEFTCTSQNFNNHWIDHRKSTFYINISCTQVLRIQLFICGLCVFDMTQLHFHFDANKPLESLPFYSFRFCNLCGWKWKHTTELCLRRRRSVASHARQQVSTQSGRGGAWYCFTVNSQYRREALSRAHWLTKFHSEKWERELFFQINLCLFILDLTCSAPLLRDVASVWLTLQVLLVQWVMLALQLEDFSLWNVCVWTNLPKIQRNNRYIIHKLLSL